ncbi:guanylate kinase [Thalassorhabdomicrobium marinisediminis]|uniref:Guanylate kinase n=1 Tax=Thalassorhabdomicrobium marinisediminis TaxID=2170577 RepID=A0A2T7FUT2_9RHOB|nr:guanylate kinase [Thalassorhabdomicrobium marinisediminis]PVA05926.1 guanylate kinase [Thalassorhabdomicrobium marinisediminis]
MKRRGLLIILSSPSGAGKSFHSKLLREWDPSIRFSVSATTRPARVGEVDGVDYHFVTREAFTDLVENGEMLEHATVFDNLYGSPKAPVKEAMGAGLDTLFDIDWQGGQQIRNSSLGNDVVSIFLLPPSMAVLEHRLRSRGQDSDEVIANRMAKSLDEVSHWAEYDYVLVNDDADACAENLKAILTAERLRRERQHSLNDFVRDLQTEYEGDA